MSDDSVSDDGREPDDWSGSMKRPWYNPPARRGGSGTGEGWWRWTIAAITLVVVAVVVVLVLVDRDVLPRPWAYAVLPVAIFAAGLSRVVTILKARTADRRDLQERDGPPHDTR
ncbi:MULTISPECIES: hypothetical protein [unclassified Aeromicrobium]|uniref:hypothetical protein n=1 Tax=unclassified Aeromicrobium TaxID=2633570 RepID=UPI0006F755E5|nr:MULTISPECIES: hypothetical protein [unclassified Aeromicrobium]KQO41963.1 hypothetical protein ASF05_12825 [Aeromicrobium sp. Leaf245]KQP27273.1 hypothetical protein ASF38_05830 [Aeromicrobium sp. Leaf272]KQP81327.1 hypothetical protein ASF35_14820 [Aeromicrobium sp. Leaf291]